MGTKECLCASIEQIMFYCLNYQLLAQEMFTLIVPFIIKEIYVNTN